MHTQNTAWFNVSKRLLDKQWSVIRVCTATRKEMIPRRSDMWNISPWSSHRGRRRFVALTQLQQTTHSLNAIQMRATPLASHYNTNFSSKFMEPFVKRTVFIHGSKVKQTFLSWKVWSLRAFVAKTDARTYIQSDIKMIRTPTKYIIKKCRYITNYA